MNTISINIAKTFWKNIRFLFDCIYSVEIMSGLKTLKCVSFSNENHVAKAVGSNLKFHVELMK